MGALLLFLQDPTLEEILREFEQDPDSGQLEERLRESSETLLPDMATRIVGGLSKSEWSSADRVLLEFVGGADNEQVRGIFNRALANPDISATRRLDLAEALGDAEGINRSELYEEIASGDGSPTDRLRAINGLWPIDNERARELATEVMGELSPEKLSTGNTLSEVVLLARGGDPEARAFLVRAVEDESLPPEVRFEAAEALRTLENVENVDTLLRSLIGLRDSNDPKVAARARKLEKELDEPSKAPPVGKRRRARNRTVATEEAAEHVSTFQWNLTMLSIVVLLGALFVLVRRKA